MARFESEEIARDIMNHVKRKQLKFWSTRYEIKKGIKKSSGGIYDNQHHIARGVLYLLNKRIFRRVSQRRHEVVGDM